MGAFFGKAIKESKFTNPFCLFCLYFLQIKLQVTISVFV
jgi:hypothetical protein